MILKVCGATRGDILRLLLLENALVGGLAGGLALLLGSVLAAVFVRTVLDLPFRLFPGQALAVVAGAAGLSVTLGLTGIWRLLGRKAGPSLRNE